MRIAVLQNRQLYFYGLIDQTIPSSWLWINKTLFYNYRICRSSQSSQFPIRIHVSPITLNGYNIQLSHICVITFSQKLFVHERSFCIITFPCRLPCCFCVQLGFHPVRCFYCILWLMHWNVKFKTLTLLDERSVCVFFDESIFIKKKWIARHYFTTHVSLSVGNVGCW